MLSKENCIQAIAAWEIDRENYTQIESLISPTSVFRFSREQCDWLNEHNANTIFHTYVGVHNANFILILVPVDADGNEVDLTSYETSQLSPLSHDIDLIQKTTIEKTIRTSLSVDLMITDRRESILMPFQNEPSMSEAKALNEIQSWRNKCLDWFYDESSEYAGQRIFRAFRVPLSDLANDDRTIQDVYCLFGLKKSAIYQRLVPVLIFVAYDGTTRQAQILLSDHPTTGNTDDFDSPCPPFCRDSSSFSMLT